MTDYFALLQQARSPWLDAELLKNKFLSLTATVHPDRVHNAPPHEKAAAQEQYTLLNAAYQALKEPKDRLFHLYQLETGQKISDLQQMGHGQMDFIFLAGQLSREVDQFLKEKGAVSSPILKVQVFTEGQEWSDKIESCVADLTQRREPLLQRLKELGGHWQELGLPEKSDRLEELKKIYHDLSFLNRWAAQLREKQVQLSLLNF